MKNLGRIFLLLFLISNTLYSGVIASVDSQKVQRGDVVTFSLKLIGKDIQRPNIYDLCGADVISTSEARSIQMTNNTTQTDYILTYKFEPKQTCTIKPLEVLIDGKKEKTKAIDIVVEKVVPSKDGDFSLSLFLTKKEVFVGESFELVLMLKQKKSASILDNKFIEPNLKGFWKKANPKQERGEDDEFIVTKVTYSLSAQREGILDISAAQMKIASRKKARIFFGGFFPEVKWKNYFSNELSIKVKALPSGVTLVGDFKIEASADKTVANANEAINISIKVYGDGNLEDIKSFKPYIDGVSIFDEKIVIDKNKLSQEIAFVGDESFIVEAFVLKYFDIKTKTIKSISTQPIHIEIKNAKVKQELTIKRDNNKTIVVPRQGTISKEIDTLLLGITFIFGLGLGIFLMFLKEKDLFIRKRSLDIKNHKVLLVKLIPYKENEDVKEIVSILESNLYSSSQEKIDIKVIKEIVKKYKIS